jgi:hypothetical protein
VLGTPVLLDGLVMVLVQWFEAEKDFGYYTQHGEPERIDVECMQVTVRVTGATRFKKIRKRDVRTIKLYVNAWGDRDMDEIVCGMANMKMTEQVYFTSSRVTNKQNYS